VTRARGRAFVAIALVVLAALLAPLSVAAIWVHQRVIDTDGYVSTVAPLADDRAVTDAVATRVVKTIFERADVQNRITGVLPGPVDALGNTLSSSLRHFATGQTERFLASDAFAHLWEEANRIAHDQVVKMFTGRGEAVSTHDDRVVLDLGVVADAVRRQLVDRGVGVLRHVSIPRNAVEITLLESDAVPKLQPAFRTLDALVIVLPIVTVVVIAGAVAVARRRRRTVIALGLSIAASTVLLIGGLHLARREYLDAVSARDIDLDTAGSVFDTLTGALERWAWILVAIALIVSAVAFASDPHRIAAVLKRSDAPSASLDREPR
jgi:hypothetical protein